MRHAVSTGCIRPTTTPDVYVLSGIAQPEIRRSQQPERARQTTYRPATQPPSPPAREESPTLSKQFHFNLPASPVLARRSPCREVARTVGANRQQSKEIQHPHKLKNDSRVVTRCRGVHGGRPTECARNRPPPRQGNKAGATGTTKTVHVRRSHIDIIMTSCTHFGERPSVDDIAEMKDEYVRWLSAVADTTR